MPVTYSPWFASPLSERFVYSFASDGFEVPFETPSIHGVVSQNFKLGHYGGGGNSSSQIPVARVRLMEQSSILLPRRIAYTVLVPENVPAR